MTLYTEAQILQGKSKQIPRRKSLMAAFVLILLMVAVFFSGPFFRSNPTLRLPLSIGGAIIAMYCSYTLFKNYQMADLPANEVDTLSHKLALIELQKQIKQEFQ